MKKLISQLEIMKKIIPGRKGPAFTTVNAVFTLGNVVRYNICRSETKGGNNKERRSESELLNKNKE